MDQIDYSNGLLHFLPTPPSLFFFPPFTYWLPKSGNILFKLLLISCLVCQWNCFIKTIFWQLQWKKKWASAYILAWLLWQEGRLTSQTLVSSVNQWRVREREKNFEKNTHTVCVGGCKVKAFLLPSEFVSRLIIQQFWTRCRHTHLCQVFAVFDNSRANSIFGFKDYKVSERRRRGEHI